MGYRSMQGTFQTGVYDIAYVHNELLQLLLDVGWLPTLALCYVVVRSFFRKDCGHRNRLIMLVILGHSMMDFDLQFLAMWFLLLPTFQLVTGSPLRLRRGKLPAIAVGFVLACICLWLTAGDALFRGGQTELALAVTPFHTQALEYRLTQISDADELGETADRLLELNSCSSLAHSARANAAFAAGDIATMIEEKQQAISCSPYDLEEYCDYFQKVYQVMSWYQSQVDTESAEVCRTLLLEIPAKLGQVLEETSELAWKLDDTPQLELPAEYQQLLASIASSYTVPGKTN